MIETRPVQESVRADREPLLGMAMQAARVGLWCWECQSDRFAPSDALAALFGFPAGTSAVGYAELQGRVHPDDRELLDATIRRAIKQGTEHQLDYRVVHPDGAVRWLANRAQVERDPGSGRALRMIGMAIDITERKLAEERVAYLAHHDPLTGLPNRVLLRDRIEHAVACARRDDSRVAVLFLDLDDFKAVNDSQGHDVGDALLKSVAARILACVREGDTVARVGGDEFVIVLPDIVGLADASSVAAKIIAAVETPVAGPAGQARVTASVGISVHPSHGRDAVTLLRHADAAMYNAKSAGGGSACFFAGA